MIKKNRAESSIFKNKLFLILTIITGLFIFVDSRIRPQIITLAKYKVQSVVTQAANQAIIEQMEQSPLSYGELINVQGNENGYKDGGNDYCGNVPDFTFCIGSKKKGTVSASLCDKNGNLRGGDSFLQSDSGKRTYYKCSWNKSYYAFDSRNPWYQRSCASLRNCFYKIFVTILQKRKSCQKSMDKEKGHCYNP